MPKSGKSLVSPDTIPHYHCVSGCVHHAFICGQDTLTGQNFNHHQRTEGGGLTVDIEGCYGDFFVPVN